MGSNREAMRAVLERANHTVSVEHADVPLPIEGSLPPGLSGVPFRDGPGRFERGGRRYAHPFDGDGHVVRIELGADSGSGRAVGNGSAGAVPVARYTSRFVRTADFLAEKAAGRVRARLRDESARRAAREPAAARVQERSQR